MEQLDPFYEERISKDTKPTTTNKSIYDYMIIVTIMTFISNPAGSTPSGSLNTKTLLFSRQSNMLDKSVRTNKLQCQDQEDTLITVKDEVITLNREHLLLLFWGLLLLVYYYYYYYSLLG